MGSSYKTTIFFFCLISFDCGLQIDAGRHQSQSHLASLLAGGLITLMLQEAVKGKGGGFNTFRNALLLPNHQIHPETLNTPLSSYGSFLNFETYRNIPKSPIFGHSFGKKPFFQPPAALKYHTSALIGNFIETEKFPSIGQYFANPYYFGFQAPSPVALNYNLDYFFTLRGLCKNIAKLNIQDLHTNTLDNLVGVKNSDKKFERILQSTFEKKHPEILQDIYLQGITENEIQNGPGHFPQGFQQNIDEEQRKNQMHDFPHNVRQGHPENLPWQFVEDITNNMRQGHRENLPQHLTQHFVNNAGHGHRENLPVHLQQHFPTNAEHGPRENLPVDLQQHFANNAVQGHPENIPQHLPQHFPNNAGQGHRQNLPQHFPNDAGQELRENLPQHNTQNNLDGKIYQNPTKHFVQDSPPDVKQSYPQNLPYNAHEDFHQNPPTHSVEDFPRHVKQRYQKNNQQTTQQYVPQHQKSLTQDFPNNFEDDLQQQLAKDFNKNFANGFLEYVTQDNPQNGAIDHPENDSSTENSPPKLNQSSHLYIQRNEFNQTSDSKTDGSDISFPTEEKGEKNNKSESSFIDEIFIVNI